jgi:hypothetical protein
MVSRDLGTRKLGWAPSREELCAPASMAGHRDKLGCDYGGERGRARRNEDRAGGARGGAMGDGFGRGGERREREQRWDFFFLRAGAARAGIWELRRGRLSRELGLTGECSMERKQGRRAMEEAAWQAQRGKSVGINTEHTFSIFGSLY